MKEYIGIRELSNKIHLSVSQLYMMTSTRKIPHLKIGKRVLFDPEQIERWMTEQVVKVVEVMA